MATIKEQLSSILHARSERCQDVDRAIREWQNRCESLACVCRSVEAAEKVNPAVKGSAQRLLTALESGKKVIADYQVARIRFARNTLCIGVGGAAGMGKSTFLQAVTGLDETQIPTSDRFFTTAVRSQIENSENESIAIADFHSESSFLWNVIEPMCRTLRISKPNSLDEFRHREFKLAEGERSTQESEDILQRLRDAQTELGTYEKYLTGERGVRIELAELRPYVAYPEGGKAKAGPFLAIADLVIKAQFPATDVAQLKLVDLPGLGEAGRDLAEVQTSGMKDVCDITLLMKRPNPRIEWTATDSNALDAIGRAVSLLEDQTAYTLILVNDEDSNRTNECIKHIQSKLEREFQIVPCNARNRESVSSQTMPAILRFLAAKLPVMDENIMNGLEQNAKLASKDIALAVEEVKKLVCSNAPGKESDYAFADGLLREVTKKLTDCLGRAAKNSTATDDDWVKEVEGTRKKVKQWIDAGCGYGSRDKLVDEIRQEINIRQGQPSSVINECRNKFRAEWETMDLHLGKRIAKLLGGTLDELQQAMHDFIPGREDDSLEAVRRQILALADRIDARPQSPQDESALQDLSSPLRRIAGFDLQFRFHLEPMLHATTHLLTSNEFPPVQGPDDAETFCETLLTKLREAADAYATGMLKSGEGFREQLGRKKRLLEKAIPDKVVRNDIISLLEQAIGTAQTFCPNRIFHAVLDSFADAFIRQKNSRRAFNILVLGWRNELSEAPDERTRCLNEAAGVLLALKL